MEPQSNTSSSTERCWGLVGGSLRPEASASLRAAALLPDPMLPGRVDLSTNQPRLWEWETITVVPASQDCCRDNGVNTLTGLRTVPRKRLESSSPKKILRDSLVLSYLLASSRKHKTCSSTPPLEIFGLRDHTSSVFAFNHTHTISTSGSPVLPWHPATCHLVRTQLNQQQEGGETKETRLLSHNGISKPAKLSCHPSTNQG